MLTSRIWSSRLSNYETIDNNGIEVKKLNLLIGINNSGKSRFIRTLFSSDKEALLVSTSQIINLTKNDKSILEILSRVILNHHDSETKNKYVSILNEFPQTINNINDNLRSIVSALARSNYYNISHIIKKEVSSDTYESLNERLNESTGKNHHHKPAYYIPIMRGMKPITKDAEDSKNFSTTVDAYKDRTFFDYFDRNSFEAPTWKNKNHDRIIITGLDLYEKFADMLLGEPDERETVRKYEKMLSKHFFENQQVSIIPTAIEFSVFMF
jgi:hypothetical protein